MEYEQIYRNFRRNVRYLRQVYGISQKGMARIAGISVATLQRIESGRYRGRLRADILRSICVAFRVSSDAFLDGDLEVSAAGTELKNPALADKYPRQENGCK